MVTKPDVPVPTSPGVYLFRDGHGRVLYVGKAKSLRARISNYFGTHANLQPRIAAMVEMADSVEWVVAESEVEAFMLEYSLIKEHRPRFNIRLRDDKSYPYLAVTLDQEWPRPMVVRGRKRKGVMYFGPYAHAYAIRETLDLLLRTFPVRTCSDKKFSDHERIGRPCLYHHIERCSAPCVGRVTHDEYDGLVADLVEFLGGKHAPIVDRLEKEMYAASDALEFEHAARLRDQLESVRRASARQQVVTDRREDLDVVGLHGDDLETGVHIFYVRGGRITGQTGFMVENVEEKEAPDLLTDILLEIYGGTDEIPRAVEVPFEPADAETLAELLTRRRRDLAPTPRAESAAHNPLALTMGDPGTANYPAPRSRGGRVVVHVPTRGEKKELLDTAAQNAREAFVRHRLRRQRDHTARDRALAELKDALGLPTAPLRIECFDISQVQGAQPVASMVVFEDALPKKDQYRRFAIRTVTEQDDFAMMREALTRRFKAYLKEREGGDERRRGRFAYPPGLLLVDGGRGQLNVALSVLEELDLDDQIPAAGLAKRFEEIYMPGLADPVRLPRGSEALYLLQRVRDEAHRFAITYHRQRRTQAMTASALDEVPGVGPARRKRLLDRFGSLDGVRRASAAEIAAVPGIPAAVAESIHEQLHMPKT
ncbi:MAG: excinuclease ABC subunit UvrC [Acidimicrobiia bacterium]|nr:excinuclease ABC subunit UvrC [Acidimicrobiia bacterium]